MSMATPFRFWVHPNFFSARTVERGKATAYWRRGDLEDAVGEAERVYSEHCDVRFEVTRNRSRAHVAILHYNHDVMCGHFPDTCASGLWLEDRKEIWLHTGYDPSTRTWKRQIGNPAGYVAGEFGHSNWMFGPSHSDDRSCLMSHKSRSLCPREIRIVQRKYGKPPKPAPPPEPEPTPEPPQITELQWRVDKPTRTAVWSYQLDRTARVTAKLDGEVYKRTDNRPPNVRLIQKFRHLSVGRHNFRLEASGQHGASVLMREVRIDAPGSGGWTNPDNAADVNADGRVSPVDALLVVNWLNSRGSGPVPKDGQGPPFVDATGDGRVSAADVLAVINGL